MFLILQFYGLWKDPNGLKVMGSHDSATTLNGVSNTESKQTIFQLNQEIQKLRQELSQVRKIATRLVYGTVNPNSFILRVLYCT